MSTPEHVDAAVRELMVVLPRVVGRLKRIPAPEPLRSLDLTPRHVSLLSLLLHDGPSSVSELAERLSIAPTTVSLVVAELSRKHLVRRDTDEADRRRRIVDIDERVRPEVSRWIAPLARGWRQALEPLTAAQRRVVVDTLVSFEGALARAVDEQAGEPTGDGSADSG